MPPVVTSAVVVVEFLDSRQYPVADAATMTTVEPVTVIFDQGFAPFIGDARKVKGFKVQPGDTDIINDASRLIGVIREVSKTKTPLGYRVKMRIQTRVYSSGSFSLSFTINLDGDVVQGSGQCQVEPALCF